MHAAGGGRAGSTATATGTATVRWLAAILLAGFAVSVVGGYWFNWTWTGFQANDTLWDWLNLVLLPLTVALVPLWLATQDRLKWYWVCGFAAVATALILAVTGGYLFDWRWTGVTGNTLWDWMRLLLVPTVLPLSVRWLTIRQSELQALRQAAADQRPVGVEHGSRAFRDGQASQGSSV